jgi:hypothetical protein
MMRLRWVPRIASGFLVVALLSFSATTPAATFTYQNDFSSDAGAATLLGSAVVVNGSLRLTDALNSQQGVMAVDALAPQLMTASWTATFDLATGPGTSPPADGVSFTFGPQEGAFYGEEGMWRFLVVSFDTYDNGDPDHIGIDVKWHNQYLATSTVNPYTNGEFVPVRVRYDADGTLDVIFNGVPVFTDLPTGYNMKYGDSFGFGGRTGASNSVQRIDNVVLTVTPLVTPIPVFELYGLVALVLLILLVGFINRRRLARN